MLEMVEQRINKAIRDAGGVPCGLIEGPQRVMVFQYRGLDMAMYADEITYTAVKEHIERKTARYKFPICRCGNEMPAGMREGMTCSMCILKHTRTL